MARSTKKEPKKKTLTASVGEDNKKKGLYKPKTLTLSGEDKELKPVVPIPTEGARGRRPRKKKKDIASLTPAPAPAPEPNGIPEQTSDDIRKAAVFKENIVVTFVCTGNTCRSAMAQYLFEDYLKKIGKEKDFTVCSAGLSAFDGADMSEYAKQALAELGISGINHFARRLTREQVLRSHLTVCMTQAHLTAIGPSRSVTSIAELTGDRDVPDPFGGTLDDYRKTAAYLAYACADVYDRAAEMYAAKQE